MTALIEAPVAAPAAAANGGVSDAAGKYLCLAVGGATYGVGIAFVREILDVVRTTPLPMTPTFVRGVMNLRGAVIPVIDLAARFGGPAATLGRRSAVVIVELGRGSERFVVGVLVDGVSEVLDIPADALEPVPGLGTRVPREFLAGMAKARGAILPVLDLARTLDRAELAELIAGHAAP